MLCALPSHILVMIMDSHELQLREEVSSDFQSFQHQCTAVSHQSLRITSTVSMQLETMEYHTISCLKEHLLEKMVLIGHFTNYLPQPPLHSLLVTLCCNYLQIYVAFELFSYQKYIFKWNPLVL